MSDPETIRCDACGKPEHIHLIDAKDDGTGNYTILQCIACYGAGWMPCAVDHLSLSVRPDLKPLYDQWRKDHP